MGPVYGFQWRHFGAEYTDMHADYTGRRVWACVGVCGRVSVVMVMVGCVRQREEACVGAYTSVGAMQPAMQSGHPKVRHPLLIVAPNW